MKPRPQAPHSPLPAGITGRRPLRASFDSLGMSLIWRLMSSCSLYNGDAIVFRPRFREADENRQCRLKYCTARSCCSAAARLLKVPRLRRLPVFGFGLRE
jgi:hypothetical protein